MTDILPVENYTFQTAAVADGNGTTANVGGLAGIAIQVVGITTATINFEVNVDGTNWAACLAKNLATGAVASTATANGIYYLNVAGLAQLRCRISGWAVGTITITGKAVQMTSEMTSLSLVGGDIELGQVELKDADSTAEANIKAANTARTTATNVLAVQHIDASGNVLPGSPVLGAGSALIGKVDVVTSTPTIYNVTCTVADTEYSQALPTNCRFFEFQARTQAILRFAFVTGKVATPVEPYMTLKAGTYYYSPSLNQGVSPSTLFVASPTGGTVVSLICWV